MSTPVKIRITKHVFLDQLHEIIRESGPDFVYQTGVSDNCSYLPNDLNPENGCLIGRMLSSLGVTTDTLKAMDAFGTLSRHENLELLRHAGITFSTLGLAMAQAAQSQQDAEVPYGQIPLAILRDAANHPSFEAWAKSMHQPD